MRSSTKLVPYEIARAVQERESSPRAKRGERRFREPRSATLRVTPLAAFAASALAASALAAAFALGRHFPLGERDNRPAALKSLDEVRRRPPLIYEQLQVDLGEPQTAAPATTTRSDQP